MTHFRTFVKWCLCAVLIGAVVGCVGTLFHYLIKLSAETFALSHFRMVWLLPLVGVVIVASYKCCGMDNDKGTNMILVSVRSEEKPPIFTAPLIFLSTVLTHLAGGSAGREGAAIQMGGGIGYQVGRLLRLDEKDQKLIIMCGMSAAFSALFGTPVTAAIFSMEVISVGAMYYSALVPSVISALVGYCIAIRLGVEKTFFELSFIPSITIPSVVRVTVLAVLCGLLSIVFCIVMHGTGKLLKKAYPNKYIKILLCSALLINLTYLVGNADYNGAGMALINDAVLSGHTLPQAFALKLLFTAITLGAGFRGGEIVPSFVVGATFGCLVAPVLGISGSFAAAVGMIAVFCGVTNCPITSIILSVEMFGPKGLIFFAVAVATSYMLSGYYGLYMGQKILYSKDKAEFINTSAH
ncbi:MAG: chloride channel protein [Clostridia bacterium]|nr:chloride channel protein [Clostridia bacterium]